MMDALQALQTRNSRPKLTEPAPTGEQREQIFRAALRAPDHANLKPWRFLCVEGEGRQRLGEQMQAAALAANPDLDEAKRDKLLAAPLRAPLVVIAVVKTQQHPKVPEIEQFLSAGAAATNLLNAAHALGYAGIWRTGDISFNRNLMERLGLAANEHIVGFLYLGTADGEPKPLPQLEVEDFFESWPS